jgi:MoCo/4Fe-4S cofactor protein with predicted Tat translocation signal
MEENNKIYWKGIEQLTNDPEFIKYAEKEFPEYLKIKDSYGDNTQDEESNGTSRRDFLKLMGFSVAAVSLASCETSVKHAIPYLNKPETIDPSIANYYASTFIDGSEAVPVVVKTREGRPIFVEGNAMSSITKGGTNPRVNASVLSLYDKEKAKAPSVKGKEVSWEAIDAEITGKLASAGQIRIVANTITSPSTKRAIAQFIAKYPNTKLVQYDAVSRFGIVAAHQKTKGKAVLPAYDFSKASVVVTLGADFLGSWISDIEHAKQFSQTRKIGKIAGTEGDLKKEMSRLYAFESILSITGASADYREPIKPSQQAAVAGALYNAVAAKLGKSSIGSFDAKKFKYVEKAANDLVAAKGKSLVVAGSNDTDIQVVVNGINEMLENYGQTIDVDSAYSYQRQGDDTAMASFIQEVGNGSVGAVIFYNCNPVYDHPLGATLAQKLPSIALSVSTSDRIDETGKLCGYHTPDTHYLEAWNDSEIKRGFFSLAQPTIGRIFNTRQVQDSLLKWAGSNTDYLTSVKEYWKSTLFPLQTKEATFEEFWTRCLHNGVFETKAAATYVSEHDKNLVITSTVSPFDYASLASELGKYKEGKFELVVMENTILGTGSQANNPYLHETPEPISKVCWGNFIAVSVSDATELKFEVSELLTQRAKLIVGGKDYTLPVIIQPGLAKGVVAISLGYGRDESFGKVAKEAGGVNAYPFLQVNGTVINIRTEGINLEAAGTGRSIPQTQTFQTIMGRETIVQESVLAAYQKDEKAGRFFPKVTTAKGKTTPTDLSAWDIKGDGYKGKDSHEPEKKKDEETEKYEKSLWNNRHPNGTADVHKYPNHHWGLAIDLNSCTGCSACVVACHMENNVPIVGSDQIIKRREMHWLRIDRYYSSIVSTVEAKKAGLIGKYDLLIQASDNPEVVFQPMMCQHCNNAPCETVCPVAATTHSSEGLNQMAYNRCIGTKYCANNCPYKVRRFNWFKFFGNDEFDYNTNNDLGRMVLNPDVTVRSRGVMEKCSMCVQRTQSGKLKAKIEKRPMQDGEVITACASACPSDAIIFGDLNNPESRISKVLDHEVNNRAYNVLAEINTRPNVWYLTKIRNKDVEKTEKA